MVLWLPSPFDDGVGLLVVEVAGATVGDPADGAAAAGLLMVGVGTFGAAGCALVETITLVDGSDRTSIPASGVGAEPKELN